MPQVESEQDCQPTRTLLFGIWGHLKRRRRIQLTLLLLVMLASGGAELVSLGAVLPFLAVLSDPERLWQDPLLQFLALRVGITGASQLLLPSTVVFALAVVLAALIRMINMRLNSQLAAAVGTDLSCEAYRRTLYQPYRVHVQRNSSEVITGAATQIGLTVLALNSLLELITSAVVTAGLLIGLMFLDALVAISAAALFGGAYFLIALLSRRELLGNSRKIAEATTKQITVLQEGLGAIRDIILDGSQPAYLYAYQQADSTQRRLESRNVFLGVFPRYALEALGMLSIALLGSIITLQRGSGFGTITMLGTLALGAQRLLPALQLIYRSWAYMKGYNSAIKSVLEMLNQSMPPLVHVAEPLPLRECIHLEGVHFRYTPEHPEVLRGLDLEIRRGERIGLLGTTGCGKSTTVDLLMGLLEPTAGRLLVDGEDLHDPEHPERLAAWWAAISHVPQSIYLTDSSIAENIAFGVPLQQIDMARVKKAADQAQISSFIEASPEVYNTFVGERGIRLSGGQRQRIGIARALYKQSRLLVLDEATSALDSVTEASVMQAIEDLSRSLTVVIIAHRLSTIASCDRVIELKHGCIVRETTGAAAASSS
jgi:ATP-binding cassette, subfamily B, bacterial PglK